MEIKDRDQIFHLLNPPGGPHQTTAYLSATVMSSNRPDTVTHTYRGTQSHKCHSPIRKRPHHIIYPVSRANDV